VYGQDCLCLHALGYQTMVTELRQTGISPVLQGRRQRWLVMFGGVLFRRRWPGPRGVIYTWNDYFRIL